MGTLTDRADSAAPPISPARDKTVDVGEAVRLIRSGDSVVIGGFAGSCFPEALTLALEQRFLETGAPRDLTLVFTVAATPRLCGCSNAAAPRCLSSSRT